MTSEARSTGNWPVVTARVFQEQTSQDFQSQTTKLPVLTTIIFQHKLVKTFNYVQLKLNIFLLQLLLL